MSDSVAKGYYAIPKSMPLLPAFRIPEGTSQSMALAYTSAAAGRERSTDEDTMRQCVQQLSRELDTCLCRLEESGLERELLVAERTHLIIQLQVCTSTSVRVHEVGGVYSFVDPYYTSTSVRAHELEKVYSFAGPY